MNNSYERPRPRVLARVKELWEFELKYWQNLNMRFTLTCIRIEIIIYEFIMYQP